MEGTPPVIRIGGVEITSAQTKLQRMSMMIWGPSGAGKTTLACTAPGKKLLINFDPDGPASVSARNDVDVVDLSTSGPSITDQFKSDTSPLGLARVIDMYDTYIVDSTTSAQHLATMYGVEKTKGSTVEKPSTESYQYRNALVIQLVKNVLRLTGKHNKHVIFIAHEDAPYKDKEGAVVGYTIMLGGKMVVSVPVEFSEVWNLSDTGKTRRIGIRPVRMRSPCKTRMFKTDGAAEFEWHYDEHNIATWYNAWQAGGFQKLPLPK